MKLPSSTQGRLFGVAVLMALIAGCGGGAGPDTDGAPTLPPGPPMPPAEVRGWSNRFGSASVVLGQVDFDQVEAGPGITAIVNPSGNPAVSTDGRLYVGSNNQLLIFDQYDRTNGPLATLTLSIQGISGVSIQGAKVVVPAGNRVHIFDPAPDSGAASPTRSIGTSTAGCNSSSFNQPKSAVLTPLGHLIVADSSNNRVLIWNSVPATGPMPPPDVVLGQRFVDTCVENDDLGDGAFDGQATARTMFRPASVWSDGTRLVVADRQNSRVLIWDSLPTPLDLDSHFANHVLGQENFADTDANRRGVPSETTLSQPNAVDVSAAGELAVSDSGNNRVLI